MNEQIPQHVAIIMDGNGRWAEQQGLLRVEGHRAGVNSVKTIIRSCVKQGIRALSLFAFSSENWRRPEQEVAFLMQLFVEALTAEIKELHGNGIRIFFTGDRTILSNELQQEMHSAEELTAQNQHLLLNIVVNYGGKWDITQATQQIAAKVLRHQLNVDDIDEHCIAQHLSMQLLPEPDLFIRTSGEQRISNFFLWQLAYTELYFTDINWPDFGEEAFQQAIDSFRQRLRRYGKTSQQVLEAAHV